MIAANGLLAPAADGAVPTLEISSTSLLLYTLFPRKEVYIMVTSRPRRFLVLSSFCLPSFRLSRLVRFRPRCIFALIWYDRGYFFGFAHGVLSTVGVIFRTHP